MKKLSVLILSVILCAACAFSGCAANSADTVFAMRAEKPWKNSYEKCVYDYFKTDKEGNLAASGEYVVEISHEGDETIIESKFTVNFPDGKTDSMESLVKMDSTSLYPHYSQKTITDVVGGNGYSVTMDYQNKKATATFENKEVPAKPEMTLPSVSETTFDSKQLYWVVRCASNLGAEQNSGQFSVLSGVDSFVSGAAKTYGMIYSVGSETSISCQKMSGKYGVAQDGKIPVRAVNLKINANRSGSTTTMYFAISPFEHGGDTVLVQFSRPQYSLSTLSLAYTHTYTLSDYTFL